MNLEMEIAKLYAIAIQRLMEAITDAANPAKQRYWLNVARSINREIDQKSKEILKNFLYPTYEKEMDKVEAMLQEFISEEVPYQFGETKYRAVAIVADNLINNINNIKYFVGRRAMDFFREAQLIETGIKWATGESWKTLKKQLIKRIKEAGYTEFIDRKGRRWDLHSYANMVARTTTRQVVTAAVVDKCNEEGHDLVRVSSHGTDCPICAPLEGQIFSLSGKHPKYPAWQGQIPAHPNCRHVIYPYSEV